MSDEMKKVFNHSKHGREAAQKMLHVHQGTCSLSDYAIEFWTLATFSGWNTEAQFDAFFNGLAEGIKDELVTLDQPANLDALVDLAICIDACL